MTVPLPGQGTGGRGTTLSSAVRALRLGAYLVSILFFGGALMGMIGRSARPADAPRQAGPRLPLYLLTAKPGILGFYENTASTPGGTGSLASLQRHARRVRSVSPFWFSIGGDGTLRVDRAQPAVAAWAHAHGVRVEPLANNLGSAMLTDPAARSRTVDTLVGLVRSRRYDGIVVDFEILPPTARPALTDLVTRLAARLHPLGRRVGVTVFPRLGVVGSLPDAYDYAALGRQADDVVLMAYDAHYDSSPPGPVAPYPWVQANLLYLLSRVPRQHVALGVGLYGYDWPEGGTGVTVDMKGALATAAGRGVRPAWDAPSGEYHYRYTDAAGTAHDVWFEGVRSTGEKAALARRYAIGSVALWRLGFETPATWPTLSSALSSGRPL
jgi:spore germination protein